jgi:hypothetical protein
MCPLQAHLVAAPPSSSSTTVLTTPLWVDLFDVEQIRHLGGEIRAADTTLQIAALVGEAFPNRRGCRPNARFRRQTSRNNGYMG